MIINDSTTDEAIETLAAMQGWQPPRDVTGRVIRSGAWVKFERRILMSRRMHVGHITTFGRAFPRWHSRLPSASFISIDVYFLSNSTGIAIETLFTRLMAINASLQLIHATHVPADVYAALGGTLADIKARRLPA